MRLGVATTILVGAGLILKGEISFMILFMFLLVITRVYAPIVLLDEATASLDVENETKVQAESAEWSL